MAKEALILVDEFCSATESATVKDFLADLDYFRSELLLHKPNRAPLQNALNYVIDEASKVAQGNHDLSKIIKRVRSSTQEYIDYMEESQVKTSLNVARHLGNVQSVMTMCRSSTVSRALIQLHKRNRKLRVLALETRPGFDGRETARILGEAGIHVSLMVDAAAQVFIEKVDAVLVGADVLLTDGQLVNRIGTYQLAVLARNSQKPFFVTSNMYAIRLVSPEQVEISQRSPYELVSEDMLNTWNNVTVVNPPDDLTPARLISAVICDKGVFPSPKIKDVKAFPITRTTDR